MKLSPKQHALLARALTGEDRQLPEQRNYTRSGRLDCVLPSRRCWYVPPGLVVPSGAHEYQAVYALRARGLLKGGSVPPSPPALPNGQGGYFITPKGRRLLDQIAKKP